MLQQMLDALPTVAGSPLALVGYACALAAWLVIGVRVQRNRNLLQNLRQLPAKDRLEALRAEMGSVPIPTTLTPEEWLRARSQQYRFLALAVLCATIVLLASLAAAHARKVATAPGIDVGLQPRPDSLLPSLAAELSHSCETACAAEPKVLSADSSSGIPGTSVRADQEDRLTPLDSLAIEAWCTMLRDEESIPARWARRSDFETLAAQLDSLQQHSLTLRRVIFRNDRLRSVSWHSERLRDTLRVRYKYPYLELFRAGGPIVPSGQPGWTYPELTVSIVNNTNVTWYLTEGEVRVQKSERTLEPILHINDANEFDVLELSNSGWAQSLDTRMRFQVRPLETCRTASFDPALPVHEMVLGTIGTLNAALTPFVPLRYRKLGFVCVAGELTYQPHAMGTRRAVHFLAPMNVNGLRMLPPPPASAFYGLWLPAGKSGYQVLFPVNHSVGPGEVDRFSIQIGTDASARFAFSLRFRSAEGETVNATHVDIDVFVPRGSPPSSVLDPTQPRHWGREQRPPTSTSSILAASHVELHE